MQNIRTVAKVWMLLIYTVAILGNNLKLHMPSESDSTTSTFKNYSKRNSTAGSKPNIIIIFADDLGHGDLVSYGHPTSKTPNLDRFAHTGQKLLQYYSAANICSPSRGAILTGRHYGRLGIYPGVFSPNSMKGLPLNETTIAAILSTVGYTTGALGKWHLGVQEYLPTEHGFDYYFGAPMTQNECWSNIKNPGSTTPGGKFGPCPLLNGSDGTVKYQGNGTFPQDPYAVDMLEVDTKYDQAVEAFIRKAVTQQKPFFFYFASHHTHAPQFASEAMTNTTKRGLFGDSLAMLDQSVGNILDLLDELKVVNNTLVIFSADNGGSLHWHDLGGVNGNMRCGKGTTWEGGHRVPTMIRWPGVVPAGTVQQGMTSSLDWFPTLCKLAGVDLPAKRVYDGYDLSALLFEGAQQSPRDTFFYHTTKRTPKLHDGGPGLMAVRKGPYKLHFYTHGSHCTNDYLDSMCYAGLGNWSTSPLLYNLDSDPGEVNLIKNSTTVYKTWEPQLKKIADEYLSTFYSLPSQMGGSSAAKRFPCCNPNCSPRPHCCTCKPNAS